MSVTGRIFYTLMADGKNENRCPRYTVHRLSLVELVMTFLVSPNTLVNVTFALFQDQLMCL